MTRADLALRSAPVRFARLAPGLAAAGLVALAAAALHLLQVQVFGRAWIDRLAIALVLGAGVRCAWTPGVRWAPGIAFSAKTLLEIGVALLGGTVTGATLLQLGAWFPLVVAVFVIVAIGASFGLGRALGLPPRVALLIACGNAICGNSAIVALAPLIRAEADEVASAVAYTALLGVTVVIALPVLASTLGFTGAEAGLLSGLTVYAVPHVLAAAAPMGPAAIQAGTIVKLMRVVMIGPASVIASLAQRRQAKTTGDTRFRAGSLAPWYIVAFIGLVILRSTGVLPVAWAATAGQVTSVLAIIAMAGLGMCSDLRIIARAGPRAGLAVTLSLSLLMLAALAVVYADGSLRAIART